jgi:hypothetical protein
MHVAGGGLQTGFAAPPPSSARAACSRAEECGRAARSGCSARRRLSGCPERASPAKASDGATCGITAAAHSGIAGLSGWIEEGASPREWRWIQKRRPGLDGSFRQLKERACEL